MGEGHSNVLIVLGAKGDLAFKKIFAAPKLRVDVRSILSRSIHHASLRQQVSRSNSA
jgi:hypothetical protein